MVIQSPLQIVLGCIGFALFFLFVIAEAQLLYAKISRWFGRGQRPTRADATVEQMFQQDLDDMNYRKSEHGLKEGRTG